MPSMPSATVQFLSQSVYPYQQQGTARLRSLLQRPRVLHQLGSLVWPPLNQHLSLTYLPEKVPEEAMQGCRDA